jgi:putative tricarboxylic transport membrane protein
MMGFGLVGYALRKLDFPLTPVVLTLVLGPIMERSLRTSLEMSRGSFSIFTESPIALGLLGCAALFLIAPAFRSLWRGKRAIPAEA